MITKKVSKVSSNNEIMKVTIYFLGIRIYRKIVKCDVDVFGNSLAVKLEANQ